METPLLQLAASVRQRLRPAFCCGLWLSSNLLTVSLLALVLLAAVPSGDAQQTMWFCNRTNTMSTQFLFPTCSRILLNPPTTPFAGGSAIDAVLRSRASAFGRFNRESPFSLDPNVPGILTDTMMYLTVKNGFLFSEKRIRANATIDYLLCFDSGCNRMLDSYWRSSTEMHLRFSLLNGTPEVFPMWVLGRPEELTVNCSSEHHGIELLGDVDPDVTVLQCLQEYDREYSFRLLNRSKGIDHNMNISSVLSSAGLADNFSERVETVFGHFLDDAEGCITLIVPRSTSKTEQNWSLDDDCVDPKGIFLFLSFVPYAYVPYGERWDGSKVPDRNSSKIRENFRSWPPYNLTIGPTPEDKYGYDYSKTNSYIEFKSSASYMLLVIGGVPIWTRKLSLGPDPASPYTEGMPLFPIDTGDYNVIARENKGRVSVSEDIYKSVLAGESIYKARFGWDYSIGESICIARFGSHNFNGSCPELEAMGLMLVTLKGKPLQSISKLLHSAFSLPSFLIDFQYPANDIVIKVSHDLKASAYQTLVGMDSTATLFGAVASLVLTFFYSLATFLGSEDVYKSCAKLAERYGVRRGVAALIFTAITAIALGANPATYLVQEIGVRQGSPDGLQASVSWYSSDIVHTVNADDESQVRVVAVVTSTYTSLFHSSALPLGWTAAVIAALAFSVSSYKVWSSILSFPLPDLWRCWHVGSEQNVPSTAVRQAGMLALAAVRFRRLAPDNENVAMEDEASEMLFSEE